jgi:hypothetical protein
MFEFLKILDMWYISLPTYVSVAHFLLFLFFVLGVVFVICGGGLFMNLLVICDGNRLLCAMFWMTVFSLSFSPFSRRYEFSRLEKYLKAADFCCVG